MSKKKISIITPCLNEEDSIEECYSKVKEIFDNELNDVDIVLIEFVNDSLSLVNSSLSFS